MNVFEAKGISLQFGTKKVLNDINWVVEKGSIATLLGPNGCGKSTLLRILTGNHRSFEGEVLFEGKLLRTFTGREMAKRMAFLPQSPELPKDMVVEELVFCGRFPYQAWWKNTATADRLAVDEALRVTKTSSLRHRYITSLSGGERQRVWIAMALAQEPEILVLDEPTTYLDINHQLEVLELLKQLNEEKGLTVLMVLHELNQAATYSHKIAILHKGTIIHAGTPAEVLTEPLLKKVFSVETEITFDTDKIPYIKIKGLL